MSAHAMKMNIYDMTMRSYHTGHTPMSGALPVEWATGHVV